jgi:hypothetical protein
MRKRATAIAPSEYSAADAELVAAAAAAAKRSKQDVIVGSIWSTDALFRETAAAIESARAKGVLAVEMEAAALHAFAQTTSANVLFLAHVTNTMGIAEEDFEKGRHGGCLVRSGGDCECHRTRLSLPAVGCDHLRDQREPSGSVAIFLIHFRF